VWNVLPRYASSTKDGLFGEVESRSDDEGIERAQDEPSDHPKGSDERGDDNQAKGKGHEDGD
jgi:hypothetical protein